RNRTEQLGHSVPAQNSHAGGGTPLAREIPGTGSGARERDAKPAQSVERGVAVEQPPKHRGDTRTYRDGGGGHRLDDRLRREALDENRGRTDDERRQQRAEESVGMRKR